MSKQISKFPRESNVPKSLSESLVGCKVLYRIPGQVVFCEGVIEEFTEQGKYVKIGNRWMPTKNHTVVAIRETKKAKRNTPYAT